MYFFFFKLYYNFKAILAQGVSQKIVTRIETTPKNK
jgi:hypothetical protein